MNSLLLAVVRTLLLLCWVLSHIKVWWRLLQLLQQVLLLHWLARWLPEAQLKSSFFSISTRFRSAMSVTLLQSVALWSDESQYTQVLALVSLACTSFWVCLFFHAGGSVSLVSVKGFLRVRRCKASESFTKSQLSHSGSVRTRSPWMPASPGGGGGGHFGVKRIGWPSEILENYPKKYQAIKFAHPKIYLQVKN